MFPCFTKHVMSISTPFPLTDNWCEDSVLLLLSATVLCNVTLIFNLFREMGKRFIKTKKLRVLLHGFSSDEKLKLAFLLVKSLQKVLEKSARFHELINVGLNCKIICIIRMKYLD